MQIAARIDGEPVVCEFDTTLSTYRFSFVSLNLVETHINMRSVRYLIADNKAFMIVFGLDTSNDKLVMIPVAMDAFDAMQTIASMSRKVIGITEVDSLHYLRGDD